MSYSSSNPPQKRCPDCGVEKPITEFGKNALLKDGLQFYCRACCSRRGAELYRRKRERLGKKVRPQVDVPPGYKRCPGCELVLPLGDWHKNAAASSGYADRCKSCRRTRAREEHLRKKFGISLEEREALVAEQGGVCAICQAGQPTHTDHNHETGQLRGLLCTGCNLGLGQFKDDPVRLMAAARYLQRHGRHKTALEAVDTFTWQGESVLEAAFRHHLAS